ncbi:MAG TPA: hypothetical protein VM073_12185 [Usitatibacter sp.]|nr:hypothetical protein [Usitatibacter sp.]
MPRDPIPEDLRRFILTSVPSVPFLEALLVYREARGEPVPPIQVSRRLYIPERAAAEVIEQLVASRFIQPVGDPGVGHRFAPEQELAPVAEQLASYYRSNLVAVTDLIHSRTGRMAQQFADAFRLRKDR